MNKIWKFILYIYNAFVGLFKNKEKKIPEAIIETVNTNENVGNPFGTVIDWSPNFIDGCKDSSTITWPKSNRKDSKFEKLIENNEKLIEKYKFKKPPQLFFSKQLIKYFNQVRSIVYDTTDYIYKYIFKYKPKNRICASLPVTKVEVPNSIVTYNELTNNLDWYKCVIGSFKNKYFNLNKVYYVKHKTYCDYLDRPIFTYANENHFRKLYLKRNDDILIKCNNFDKFEHFILFVRYEVKIAFEFEITNPILYEDIESNVILNESKKSDNNKLSFFKSKSTFKNNFKKCLIDDYNLYFNSNIGGEMHKLSLSMFFKQVEDKKEVLTYEKFNIFKSLDKEKYLDKLNVGYCHYSNETDKTLQLERKSLNDYRIDLSSDNVRRRVPA